MTNGDRKGRSFLSYPHTNNGLVFLLTTKYLILSGKNMKKKKKTFNAFERRGMYPNVFKCNAKRCVCCTHLCTKTTIKSSVDVDSFP